MARTFDSRLMSGPISIPAPSARPQPPRSSTFQAALSIVLAAALAAPLRAAARADHSLADLRIEERVRNLLDAQQQEFGDINSSIRPEARRRLFVRIT